MKIGIISTFIGQKTSGAEISAIHLCEKLKRKNDVFIICPKINYKMPCRSYNLNLDLIPNMILHISTFLTDLILRYKILEILKKEKPDYIHIQDFSILNASLYPAKKLNIKTKLTVRDYRFNSNLTIDLQQNKIIRNYNCLTYFKWLFLELQKSKSLGFLTPFLFPFFYWANNKNRHNIKRVDKIETVSNFVKNELIKNGIDSSKIKTVYNLPPKWKKEPLPNNKIKRYFAAGSLVKSKGFRDLIESFIKAHKSNKNIILYIAGDGSERKNLEKIVNDNKLNKKIIFTGRLTQQKIKEQYKMCDYVVIPSLWPEPLSRIIYEAHAIGRPVIATDVGGNKEKLKKGDILVKNGDFFINKNGRNI
ncbi:MAG: glycosyltransferase family 4 protein [Candidatus Woesearchaeota archaeon]